MTEPNLWLILGGVLVAVVVLRFVVRFAVRLAVIGLLILGALWLWQGGALDQLGALSP